jgi:hypothetical protein
MPLVNNVTRSLVVLLVLIAIHSTAQTLRPYKGIVSDVERGLIINTNTTPKKPI